MGKEEKERRKEAEDKLKGNDDKVNKPPRGMNSKVAEIYVAIVEELKVSVIIKDFMYRIKNKIILK